MTSGLNKNMRSNQLGFVMATVMAFLAAAFIITTGLSTGVTERQRELSILRCVGATRAQLAVSQLFIGAIIGGLGGLVGVPLGLGFAAVMTMVFKEQIPGGLAVSAPGLATAAAGALFSGLAGAAFPAWRATRVSPLEGLAVRSKQASPRSIALLFVAGLACLAIQVLIVTATNDGQVMFWAYATFGLPVMFIGYFLLSVPVILAVTWALQKPLTIICLLYTSDAADE